MLQKSYAWGDDPWSILQLEYLKQVQTPGTSFWFDRHCYETLLADFVLGELA